jgi:hypothetical protein
MKFTLTFLLIAFSFISSAETSTSAFQEATKHEVSIGLDRGKKKSRHSKRINKKRKRKCSQFGKRSFAG